MKFKNSQKLDHSKRIIIINDDTIQSCLFFYFLIDRAKEMQEINFFNNIKENVQVIMLNITFIGLGQGGCRRRSPGEVMRDCG